ncbi:MAG: SGNH/GDSL hydrolase family protein [Opitutaceae bacterium]|nr:SGNH/GDSL hydrolase family protein [Opitutaceae bacterium]
MRSNSSPGQEATVRPDAVRRQVWTWIVACAVAAAAGAVRAAEPGPTVGGLVWTDARQLVVEGRGWTDTREFFDRLPARAEGRVRAPVWRLSRDSAGLAVRFVTDAPTLHARWTLRREQLARPHVSATGTSGLDLYRRDEDGEWRWLAATGSTGFPANTAVLVRALPAKKREYLLYLPLYNGIASLELAVPRGHEILPAPPRPPGKARPVVFYGTSVTQGQAASRSGMVHTAILGRRLDRPVINLGFSGNGKMEPELAELLAELDPAVFVLDCVPNMTGPELAVRVEPFVHRLRAQHPATPIVLVEDRTYAGEFWLADRGGANRERRAALAAVYARLQAAGVPGLHYLPGDGLIGDDGDGTIDGSHLTDLGFYRQALGFEAVLAGLLAAEERAFSSPVSTP